MCQAKDKLIFCTCEATENEPNKEADIHYYEWYLEQYLGHYNSNRRGKIARATEDLGNDITIEMVLKQLNSGFKSFDFEYTPNDRDCLGLSIYHPIERRKYFSVIYIDNKWQPGSNNVFSSRTKGIGTGKLKWQTGKKRTDFNNETEFIFDARPSVETLFKLLLESSDSQKTWRYITEIVNRGPAFAYTKANSLAQSKKLHETIIGTQILVKLYQLNFQADTIYLKFYPLLRNHPNEYHIVEPILSSISDRNETFNEEEFNILCVFKDGNSSIKFALMDAFYELENERVISILIEFCADTDLKIRRNAVHIFADIISADSSEIRMALLKAVKEEDLVLKFDAINALALRKESEISAVIIDELEQFKPNQIENHVLFDAVENLNDPSLIPFLNALLLKHKNLTPLYKRIIAETIAAIQ